MNRFLLSLGLMTALAACEATTMPGGALREVPEEVVALAAPGQDLSTVRLMEDGCYWYQYAGPVETTMLPLVTPNGRPICTRPQTEGEA